MKKIKKFLSSLIAIMIVATMVTSNLSALEVNSSFVQNTNTSNTYGYVNMKQINLKLIVRFQEVLGIIQALLQKFINHYLEIL